MSLDLHDLMMFFEAEPKIDESDVPWEYSGATVVFESGEDQVWAKIAPGDGELAVVWRQQGVKHLELSLEGYFEMKLENNGGIEHFIALDTESNKHPFVLQLRPHVFIAIGAV